MAKFPSEAFRTNLEGALLNSILERIRELRLGPFVRTPPAYRI